MAGWRGYRRNVRGYGARGQGGSRLGAGLVALGLQIAVVAGVIAAFTPEVGREVVRAGLTAIDLTPEPTPIVAPPPPAVAGAKPAVASGAAGKRAVAAPLPKIVIAPVFAPLVASTGAATILGARDNGAGTGAGGAGAGTGSGGSGNGQDGGKRFAQIAGTIDSARDYPVETRDQRVGSSVLIVFTVGTDGRAHDCRVRQPSGDPRADEITCRLAEQRFRFRPATDASGNPVEAVYGWKQSWHY